MHFFTGTSLAPATLSLTMKAGLIFYCEYWEMSSSRISKMEVSTLGIWELILIFQIFSVISINYHVYQDTVFGWMFGLPQS